MKRVFITLILIVFTTLGQAQIEKEIGMYQDTIQTKVHSGRKLLLDYLQKDNVDKAKQIQSYLNNLTQTNPFKAFTINENLYIDILCMNWDAVLARIKSYSSTDRVIIYPTSIYIEPLLQEMYMSNKKAIVNDFEYTKYSEEEKMLLNLLLLLTDSDNTEDEYQYSLSEFNKKFPNSEYKEFMHSIMPQEIPDFALIYGVGGGMSTYHGSLTNYVSSVNPHVQMSILFRAKSLIFGFGMVVSFGDAQQQAQGEKDGDVLTVEKGDDLEIFQGGARIGYSIFKNEKFRLIPYTAIDYASMSYHEGTGNDSKKLEYYKSLALGVGFSSYYKLFTDQANQFGPLVCYGLCLDVSYSYNVSAPDEFKAGVLNLSLIFNFGFGAF